MYTLTRTSRSAIYIDVWHILPAVMSSNTLKGAYYYYTIALEAKVSIVGVSKR